MPNLANTASGLALTEAEQGIWLGQRLNPNCPHYNAAEVLDIKGRLQASSFGLALCQALAEAPALHRSFRETAAGARQYFTAIKPNVVVLDLSAEANPAAAAENWMRSDLNQVVDLVHGPLYQQALLKLAEDHHLWYQRIHHIAADGYAFALLSQRVAEIYNNDIDRRACTKPLGDYMAVLHDERTYQSSQARQASREFWCTRLTRSPRPVSLSRSRAPLTQWPLHISSAINAHCFNQIKTFAHALGCNWADVLTAAVGALVFRQTAAAHILLGLPVMGRMGTPALRVPAMVMNIAPLHIATHGLPTLAAWAAKIAAEQALCRPHLRYRYEHLRRDLHAVGGDKGLYGPVVNIMPFDRRLRFGKAEVGVRSLSAGPVEDISFAFVLQPDDSLRFDVHANPARYTRQQLADSQAGLLNLLNHPSQPITAAAEAFAWLAAAPLRDPRPCVLALFAKQVFTRPNAIALEDGDQQLSYAELQQKARHFAVGLTTLGVQPGALVALSLPRGEAAVVSCLGCLLAGAAYLFLDPKGPPARNARILQDAAPTLVVTAQANGKTDSCIPYAALFDTALLDATLLDAASSKAADTSNHAANQLAYVVYTSGSTGAPKGVMITQRALSEFVVGAAEVYGIAASDRVLQYAPLHFDASVEEIFVTLCQGATLVIRSESMLDCVTAFLQTCHQWRISVLDLPTAYWHELVYFCHATQAPLPEAVHTVIIGGEAALPERVRQWHQLATQSIRLLNTYGPSETTVVASCALLHRDAALTIGTPLPGRQLAVTDRQGRIVQRNQTGELVVLGAGIGEGYKNKPDASLAQFRPVQFPWQHAAQRAYFTGDRARITEQGTVEYLGRLDAEIKISGQRINPVEIESTIVALGLAREVAVVNAIGDGEKSLTVFMVPMNPAEFISIQMLRQQLAQHLPAPMLPTRLEAVPKLPLNAAGKVDRKALAALAAGGAKQVLGEGLSAEQKLVIQIWQQVLGVAAIDLDDDFFLRGGQSLQTIQVANRLTAALERNIAVTMLFENPTVRQLAAALNQQTVATTHSVEANAEFVKTTTKFVKDSIDEDLAGFNAQLTPTNAQPHWAAARGQAVLLTGATGFVGAELLHQLLAAGCAPVICLVRAPSTANALAKITQALAKHNRVIQRLAEKVQIVLADLEQPELGLPSETFRQLAGQCAAIFHNAANTSVMRDYQSLRAANLLSTHTLLRMAAIKGTPFHLVSTIAVAPAEGLPEDFVAWHDALHDGYQQTKWAAERSAQLAASRGQPVCIYRLARVVGDLHNNTVNNKDLIWNIAAASVRNQAFPLLPVQEPWTPVDLVARAIVANAQHSQPHPVLNIVPPTSVALQQVGQWLRDAGFQLDRVDLNEWCARLSTSSHAQDLAMLGFFQQRKTATPNLPLIEQQRTRQFLSAHNIVLPELGQSQFSGYLREAIRQQLITAPTAHTPAKRGHHEPA